mmetsp:Transcript_46743/g.144167  ORF Transcript_46743/g.144167 Transcript_46743/m.144167 type:complete len:246 (-) Transcript_46743:742-1479(-)
MPFAAKRAKGTTNGSLSRRATMAVGGPSGSGAEFPPPPPETSSKKATMWSPTVSIGCDFDTRNSALYGMAASSAAASPSSSRRPLRAASRNSCAGPAASAPIAVATVMTTPLESFSSVASRESCVAATRATTPSTAPSAALATRIAANDVAAAAKHFPPPTGAHSATCISTRGRSADRSVSPRLRTSGAGIAAAKAFGSSSNAFPSSSAHTVARCSRVPFTSEDAEVAVNASGRGACSFSHDWAA